LQSSQALYLYNVNVRYCRLYREHYNFIIIIDIDGFHLWNIISLNDSNQELSENAHKNYKQDTLTIPAMIFQF